MCLKGVINTPNYYKAQKGRKRVLNMAKTTSTINGKTSKAGLLTYLSDSVKALTDSNLKQRVEYAIKKAKKDLDGTSKSDLFDLAKEVMSLFETPSTPKLAVVENSTKPKTLSKKKTAPEAPEETAEEAEEETTEAEEKPTKKASKKPLKKKPATVETADGLTKKSLPMAKIFPAEIDHEQLGHLVAVPEKYHSLEEIRKAIAEDKTLIFAAYWTKRHIKEFGYALTHNVPVPKNGFPYDLDTLQTIYVCDGADFLYALSTYTEAMFRFRDEDLEPTECETNDGEKFLMRVSEGLEFEIYEIVE